MVKKYTGTMVATILLLTMLGASTHVLAQNMR